MNLFVAAASILVVSALAAAAVGAVAAVARRLNDASLDPRFWRGAGSAPVTVASFTPWLALSVVVLLRLTGELAFSGAAAFAGAAGLVLGAGSAVTEARYLRSRVKQWRLVHNVATLAALAASLLYVASVPPHTAELFWFFLSGFGIARFLALSVSLPHLSWGDSLDSRPLG